MVDFKDRPYAFLIWHFELGTCLLIKTMASLVPLINVSLRFMAQVIGTSRWVEQREQRILGEPVSCPYFWHTTWFPSLCSAPTSANHGLRFLGTLPLTIPFLPFLFTSFPTEVLAVSIPDLDDQPITRLRSTLSSTWFGVLWPNYAMWCCLIFDRSFVFIEVLEAQCTKFVNR